VDFPGSVAKKWNYLAITILTILFFGLLFGAILFPPEQGEKPRRVAVLMSGESRRERLLGLHYGLEELGFTEGKNVVYQVVSAGEKRQKLQALAWEIVKSEPDVLVALGGLEADAAQQAVERKQRETGRSVPVVFAGVASAAARGLYQNPQKPNQITGVENLDAELAGKRLEHFKRLVPGLKRVGVVYEPGIIPSEQGLAFAREDAPLLGLEVINYPVRSGEDVQALETTVLPGACDGLLLMPSFIIESGVKSFYRLSADKKIPVMGLRIKNASVYYFSSFGPNVFRQGQQAARLVAKILRETPLKDIPVETPDQVELVINLDIARGMGLILTPEQLQYADQLVGGTGDD
jgi:putative ABC transport system substrate-binding protein